MINKMFNSFFDYAMRFVLRSLKLGVLPGPSVSAGSCQPLVYTIRNSVDVSNFSWNDKRSRQGKESSILTRSCLGPLAGGSGSPGYVWDCQTSEFGIYKSLILF